MMTRPTNPTTRTTKITDRWKPAWLVPLVTLGLGAVILVAEATDDDLASGVGWFAVAAVLAGLHVLGGRSAAMRERGGYDEDERDAAINTRAMAIAGFVLVVVLSGCIVFELARGNDPRPYVQLMAAGGASYAVALLVLRYRS